MITLFQDKVLVRKDPEKTMEGSLYIPDISRSTDFNAFTGVVVQTGPGKVFCAKDKDGIVTVKGAGKTLVKQGDRVAVQKNSEYEIKINGEWLTLIKEQDIYGIVNESN